MKHILSFIFCLVCTHMIMAQALPTDPETKRTTFQETISMDSLSQEELYDRSITWLTNFYKTSKFDVNDKTGGKTGTEGNFTIALTYDFKYKSENTVSYNVLIYQKPGKYKYVITDFQIYNSKTGPKSIQGVETAFSKMTTVNKKELQAQLTKEVTAITDDLKNTMKSGKTKDKNEW